MLANRMLSSFEARTIKPSNRRKQQYPLPLFTATGNMNCASRCENAVVSIISRDEPTACVLAFRIASFSAFVCAAFGLEARGE